MHVDRFVRGKGKFMITEFVPTQERTGPRFPLILTTGRILSQYNVGRADAAHRQHVVWHGEDVLEIHPFDAESRGIRDGDLVALALALRRDLAARAGHRAHAAGRRLHDLPPRRDRRERCHDRIFRLGHELPRIQGHRSRRCGARTTSPNGRSATGWTSTT